MTDEPSQQSLYYNTYYRLLNCDQCSKDATSQNLAKPVRKRSEEERELDTMSKVPTQRQSQQHQPLQGDQCSSESDEIYDDLTVPVLTEEEHEVDQITNVHAQQRNTKWSQEPIQGDYDEINQGIKMKGAELDNMKAAIKKMKMVLVVTVIVNIVLLVVGTMIIVILGNILSQSKLGIISKISSQINATNSYVGELTASTESSINEISTQLTMTNGNVTSALNQLDTTKSNISYITTELNAAKSNVTTVQSQVDILQTQVMSLLPQVSDPQLQVYCGPGEWCRVAYLNMSDPTQQCPSAWREYNTSGVRACGRPSTSGGSCPATAYSINFQYRRVCGRVVGYQYGSPDGFHSGNINQRYVDGISITRGSPRQHVWTYAAGVTESSSAHAHVNCPCSSSSARAAPSFVGNNNYCESGNPSSTWSNRLYTGDKLWDGLQCEGSCCAGTVTPLWFKVQLSTTTSDDIEIRICGSELTNNEDTPIELIEIYTAQ